MIPGMTKIEYQRAIDIVKRSSEMPDVEREIHCDCCNDVALEAYLKGVSDGKENREEKSS